MAVFTHLNPEGSRFSDGHHGVYSASDTVETAIAEVVHHRSLFLSRTAEPAIDIDVRHVTASLEADLHDLRELRDQAPELHDADHYGAAQALGRELRNARSWGIVYQSVSHAGGSCVGVFRPRALAAAKATRHLALHWNGHRISHWYEKVTPKTMD